MSRMLERVARALAAVAGEREVMFYFTPNDGRKVPQWATMPNGTPKGWIEETWRSHLPSARAALEALREPDEEMKRAGLMFPLCPPDYEIDPVISNDIGVEFFRAMIAAALSEPSDDDPRPSPVVDLRELMR